MSEYENPLAFPQPMAQDGPFGGMTLRDYFASQCPLTVEEAWKVFTARHFEELFALADERAHFWHWFAMMRGEYADAMLAERSKTQ